MPHVVANLCVPGLARPDAPAKATDHMGLDTSALQAPGGRPRAYTSDESILSASPDQLVSPLISTIVDGFAVQRARASDNRRNLYVLGLPVDFAQEEFTHVFSAYGTVEHSVIMATLDQFNRRRGFIVMSSNAEAAAAMRGLSGSQLRGHQLHVSFAVVQRSEGFLDGGDRTPRRRRGTAVNIRKPANFERPAAPAFLYDEPASAMPAPALSTTVIALNLCPLTLPTAADVHALFAPHGPVRAVRLARGAPGTAVVAFETPQHAAAALGSLDGMPVGSYVMRVISAQL
ncbi:hypothetical protein AURDEDRAFT_159789 [Auricularia subglabra TFB-10046 SS5]|nr:hypothetical protein AURDEDRAFT_159789 [Auricularia subglabra TFB-10046 SS5]